MQKILLLVAVVTVIVHSVIPHIHNHHVTFITQQLHDEYIEDAYHHDDENGTDEQHSFLSFAQLDDNYIPANKLINNLELPVEFIPLLTSIGFTDHFSVKTKTHFGWYKEYPPPENKISTLSFRGPPAA